jgi:ribonuclease VapC
MIIDTSALVGILDQEPDAERLARAIAQASERMLSAANVVETGIVMQVRRGDEAARDLDLLLAKFGIEIIPVSARQASLARKAFQRFGRGHLAPLLFKGKDFAQTDIAVAPY